MLGAFGALTGCGIGTLAPQSSDSTTMALNISGEVFGGAQPISGATVTLWVTGTSGYGQGASSPIATATTAITTGAFTFPTAYTTCATNTTGPYVYITVAGGDPSGATSTTTNHAVLLADVLGNCDTVSSATHVKINEATTVAAAYALGRFSAVTAPTSSSLGSINIGAPSSNAQGLSDAVANAILLVNPNTGATNNPSATVELPTAALNTVADILSVCVNTTDTAISAPSGGCPGIFTAATPPGGSAPNNTYQIAENIAKYPGNNVSTLLTAVSSVAQYAPVFATSAVTSTTAPNDLSLAIAYPNATLNGASTGPVGLTIDTNDNVWVLGAASSTYNYLAELPSPSAGGAYTATLQTQPPFAASHTIRNGAFDASGNLWLTDKSTTTAAVIEVTKANLPALGSAVASANEEPTFTGLSSGYTLDAQDPNDYFLAIDTSGNVWTASYGGPGNCTDANQSTAATTACQYIEFVASNSYNPVNTFGTAAVPVDTPTVRGMTVDDVSTSTGYGNVWTANYASFGASTSDTIEVLNPTAGTASTITVGTSTAALPFGVTTDKVGGAYVTTYGPASPLASALASSGLFYVPQATANNGSVTTTVSTTGQATTLAGIASTNSAPASSATSAVPIGGLYNPGYTVIDGTGNVFIGNNSYGTIAEYSPTQKGFLSPYYGFAPSVSTTALPTNEVLFTCSGTTTITCTYPANSGSTTAGLVNKKSLISIAIDRAGSVWSVDSKGTLIEIIGTAAPTNPILAAGQTGTLP